jgi:hypothetical protein
MVQTMLREAADDLAIFANLPVPQGDKFLSTNPLRRLGKEIKRLAETHTYDRSLTNAASPTPPWRWLSSGDKPAETIAPVTALTA